MISKGQKKNIGIQTSTYKGGSVIYPLGLLHPKTNKQHRIATCFLLDMSNIKCQEYATLRGASAFPPPVCGDEFDRGDEFDLQHQNTKASFLRLKCI